MLVFVLVASSRWRFKKLTTGDDFSAESKTSSPLDLLQRFGQHFPIRRVARRRLFRHFRRSWTTPLLHAHNFPKRLCNLGHLFLLQGALTKSGSGFAGPEVGGSYRVLVGKPLGPDVVRGWAAHRRLRNVTSTLSTFLLSSVEIWFRLKKMLFS